MPVAWSPSEEKEVEEEEEEGPTTSDGSDNASSGSATSTSIEEEREAPFTTVDGSDGISTTTEECRVTTGDELAEAVVNQTCERVILIGKGGTDRWWMSSNPLALELSSMANWAYGSRIDNRIIGALLAEL